MSKLNHIQHDAAPRAIALIPLLTFIGLFLSVGIHLKSQGVPYPFHELSSIVAIAPCIVLAIIMAKDPAKLVLRQLI